MKRNGSYLRQYLPWLGLLLGVDALAALLLWLADARAIAAMSAVIVLATVFLFGGVCAVLCARSKKRERAFTAFLTAPDAAHERALCRLLSANEAQSVHLLGETLRRMVDTGTPPDVITFAGNGEPTMHPDFEAVIGDTIALRDALCPAAKVSVLSNATQLHREGVRRALRSVDNNILKLDSAFDATARLINNPQSPAYSVRRVVDQMKGFDGHLTVQTMFLRGEFDGQRVDNTTEEEVAAWLRLIGEIGPRQVMVYSLDRDTPCRTLEKVPREELQAIAARVEALGIPCSVA